MKVSLPFQCVRLCTSNNWSVKCVIFTTTFSITLRMKQMRHLSFLGSDRPQAKQQIVSSFKCFAAIGSFKRINRIPILLDRCLRATLSKSVSIFVHISMYIANDDVARIWMIKSDCCSREEEMQLRVKRLSQDSANVTHS